MSKKINKEYFIKKYSSKYLLSINEKKQLREEKTTYVVWWYDRRVTMTRREVTYCLKLYKDYPRMMAGFLRGNGKPTKDQIDMVLDAQPTLRALITLVRYLPLTTTQEFMDDHNLEDRILDVMHREDKSIGMEIEFKKQPNNGVAKWRDKKIKTR